MKHPFDMTESELRQLRILSPLDGIPVYPRRFNIGDPVAVYLDGLAYQPTQISENEWALEREPFWDQ